jgi:predicted amidohydrolase YtcJ
VQALLPDTSLVRVDALAQATARMAAAGITWAQDAWVEADTADAWIAAARAGRLRLRADLAWRCDPGRSAADNVTDALHLRESLAASDVGGVLSANAVKFFADGVIEGGTGALLEPYCDCAAMHGSDRGLPVWEPRALAEAVSAALSAGFAPHIHAIGDAAVRMALDAIEVGLRKHGAPSFGARPVIAHTQLVAPADLTRFAALGVVANFEPLWACLDPSQTELTAPRLGRERAAQQYRIATLLRSGAAVSFGSDWPVSSFDPRSGIRTAVTRTYPGEPVWMPEERVGLGAAVAAYTAGTAYQAGTNSVRGQIAPGFDADLAWVTDPYGVGRGGGVLPPGAEAAGEESALLGDVRGTWCAGERSFHA